MDGQERKIICRPAAQGDWPRFTQKDGSRILILDDGTEVYFLDKQIIEVHRPVIRTYSKCFGLRRWTESFIEIEEAVYIRPFGGEPEEHYFFFQFYEEQVGLLDLPDETIFVATDRFARFGGRKRKKKSFLARLADRLFPTLQPELAPA